MNAIREKIILDDSKTAKLIFNFKGLLENISIYTNGPVTIKADILTSGQEDSVLKSESISKNSQFAPRIFPTLVGIGLFKTQYSLPTEKILINGDLQVYIVGSLKTEIWVDVAYSKVEVSSK
jgi:hypothetical protein